VAVACLAGIGAALGDRHRHWFDLAFVVVVVVVLAGLLLVVRPGKESRRTGAARAEAFDRARAIIQNHGGDTLDYFALRDDKSWLFSGESLVAYSVINGVMLVSPDPIGPAADRAEGWSDVMDMAQSNAWAPSVLAASQSWLPVYRAAGLVDHYIGDEAIVDCSKFSLSGKSMKSLRGAYNRVKKAGCRLSASTRGRPSPRVSRPNCSP
jgi:lysyl-tRNA synthetase class 2